MLLGIFSRIKSQANFVMCSNPYFVPSARRAPLHYLAMILYLHTNVTPCSDVVFLLDNESHFLSFYYCYYFICRTGGKTELAKQFVLKNIAIKNIELEF